MKYILIIALLFVNLFGITFEQQNDSSYSVNLENIIVVQTPDEFEYETNNDNKKCIPRNFFCPEVQFKEINKNTNAVIKSWYLEYDNKNISKINYESGEYTCRYSTNDILEYRHNFKNEFCVSEIAEVKEEMKQGKVIFGFDYKSLLIDIEDIDTDGVVDVHDLSQQLNIADNQDEHEDKGFFTLSEMITKILTFSDDIKGTDTKMELVLSDDINTKAYNSNPSNDNYMINQNGDYVLLKNNLDNDNQLFGNNDDDSIKALILNTIGITDTQEERKNEILDSVTNIEELFETRMFGYYINWLIINHDILYFPIFILLLIIIIKKSIIMGTDRIVEVFKNTKNNPNKPILMYGVILGLTGILFLAPLDQETKLFNGEEIEYARTPVQASIETFAEYSTMFADYAANVNTGLLLDYLNKASGVYTKDEIKLFTDNIAQNLIVAQRENDFLNQQCRKAYGVGGDTFMKSDNSFMRNLDYDLFNHGVPNLNLCKNTETDMFVNLKNIDNNSRLLDYKINHQNSDLNQNLNALSTKLLLTSNDMGWVSGLLLYSAPTMYERLTKDLDKQQQKNIDNLTNNYYKDTQIESVDESFTADILDVGTAGIKTIAEHGIMHIIPSFTTIQEKIKKSLDFGDDNSNSIKKKKSSETAKTEAKGTIMGYIAQKSKSLLSKLTSTISILVSAGSTIISYVLATIIVIFYIKVIKFAIIIGFASYRILHYFVELILYYYFSFVMVLRIAFNEKNENITFVTSKIVYLMMFPVLMVLSLALLFFINGFSEYILSIITNIQIESMRLTSYIATLNENGVMDTLAVGAESILTIGTTEAIYQIISLVVTAFIAKWVIFDGIDMVLGLIGNSVAPKDNSTSIEKADKTSV